MPEFIQEGCWQETFRNLRGPDTKDKVRIKAQEASGMETMINDDAEVLRMWL